jgi:hypothetical protein
MRFMNNLKQKLNTLCHQNYIGSEKCVAKDCNDGHKCLGYHEDTDEYEWGMCDACKGKGYTIPLEFGCEVLYGHMKYMCAVGADKYSGYEEKESFVYLQDENDFKNSNFAKLHFEKDLIEFHDGINPINLGKPLTHQQVLELLPYHWVLKKNKGGKYEYVDMEHFGTSKFKNPYITLKGEYLKDQSDKVLQAIIDIV